MISHARKCGLTLSLHDILQCTSIKKLAEVAEVGFQKSRHHEKIDTPFDLSPIQKLYFEHATQFKGASRFNQSVTVQISQKVPAKTVELALRAVVGRHAMLRARFRQSGSGSWLQEISKVSPGDH